MPVENDIKMHSTYNQISPSKMALKPSKQLVRYITKSLQDMKTQ